MGPEGENQGQSVIIDLSRLGLSIHAVFVRLQKQHQQKRTFNLDKPELINITFQPASGKDSKITEVNLFIAVAVAKYGHT